MGSGTPSETSVLTPRPDVPHRRAAPMRPPDNVDGADLERNALQNVGTAPTAGRAPHGARPLRFGGLKISRRPEDPRRPPRGSPTPGADRHSRHGRGLSCVGTRGPSAAPSRTLPRRRPRATKSQDLNDVDQRNDKGATRALPRPRRPLQLTAPGSGSGHRDPLQKRPLAVSRPHESLHETQLTPSALPHALRPRDATAEML